MAISIPTELTEGSLAEFKALLKTASREERLQVLNQLVDGFKTVVGDFIESSYDAMDEQLKTHTASEQVTQDTISKMCR